MRNGGKRVQLICELPPQMALLSILTCFICFISYYICYQIYIRSISDLHQIYIYIRSTATVSRLAMQKYGNSCSKNTNQKLLQQRRRDSCFPSPAPKSLGSSKSKKNTENFALTDPKWTLTLFPTGGGEGGRLLVVSTFFTFPDIVWGVYW